MRIRGIGYILAVVSLFGWTGFAEARKPKATPKNSSEEKAPVEAAQKAPEVKAAADAEKAETAQVTGEKSASWKQSYSVGYDIGRMFQSSPIDVDVMVAGLKDGSAGNAAQLTAEDMQAALMAVRMEMMERRKKADMVQGDKNRADGQAFLEQNKKRKGVKVTASGLQYEVITEGAGRRPKASDRVKVHYKGTLIDGVEFDSSYKRNSPAEFPLGNVIRGWTEGLQLMTVGSKYKLYLPSELAYGPSGAGAQIGPNSTLVFEVELLDILE